MNFYQHSPEQINQLADALEDPDLDMNGLGWKAAFHLRELQGRIADLEAQLYAIGAGGVGQSIKPQVQADTAQAPVAWRVHPFDYGVGSKGVYALTQMPEQVEMWKRKGWKVEPLYAAPQPTENLRCKSTQKRLATLWGYVKKEPDHLRGITKMVPVSKMLEALRTKYSDLIYESNQKMAVHFEEDIFTINEFLQRIQQEAAEKARQPLKDDAKRLDWLMLNISGAEFRRIGIEYSGICTRKDIDNAIERENGITESQP